MVSVFEGQLTRTWTFSLVEKGGKRHTVNLFHDTITGVRSAMLDFEEIPDSIGNSSLLMSSTEPHLINFFCEGFRGKIEIKKEGWTSFSYNCFFNNQQLKEATETVATKQGCDSVSCICSSSSLVH